MAGADAKQPATAAQLQHTKQGSYGLIATHTKATRQQHNDKLPSPNTVTVKLAMVPGHNMVVHGGTHEYSAQCLKGLHEDCANSFQKYKPAKPDIRVHDHHHYHHKASNVQTGELRATQHIVASSRTPHYHSTFGTCQGVAHQDVTGLLAHRTDRCTPDLHQHMHTLRAAHPQSHHHYRHTVRRSHR